MHTGRVRSLLCDFRLIPRPQRQPAAVFDVGGNDSGDDGLGRPVAASVAVWAASVAVVPEDHIAADAAWMNAFNSASVCFFRFVADRLILDFVFLSSFIFRFSDFEIENFRRSHIEKPWNGVEQGGTGYFVIYLLLDTIYMSFLFSFFLFFSNQTKPNIEKKGTCSTPCHLCLRRVRSTLLKSELRFSDFDFQNFRFLGFVFRFRHTFVLASFPSEPVFSSAREMRKLNL